MITARISTQTQVFGDRQVRKDAATLGHMNQSALCDQMRRPTLNRFPFKLNRPLLWLQQPGDRTQHCRLAGTVASNQRDNLALIHAQRTSSQRLNGTVGNGDVVDFQKGHGRNSG